MASIDWSGRTQRITTAEDAQPIIDAIKATPDATSIILSGNTFGVEAAEAIAQALSGLQKLQKVTFSDMFTTRLYEEVPKALSHFSTVLATLPALEELDVSDNALGKNGALAFIGLCSARPSLLHLHANNGGLGKRGCKVIAAALLEAQRRDPSVVNTVTGMDEEDDKESDFAAPALPPLPEGAVTRLETFCAGRNRLENPGATLLSHAFRSLTSLRRLEIPQNGILPEGICALSEALACTTNLEVLNLNDNTIKREGSLALAKALPHLPALRIINLGDCMLGSEGTVAIAEALVSGDNASRKLEVVDFSYDEIDDEAAVALGRALAEQRALQRVELNGNMLKAKGREAITAALQAVDHPDALGSLSENEDSDEEDEDEDEGVDDDSVDDLAEQMAEASV